MGLNSLDPIQKELTSNKFEVTGPLIDGFVNEIDKSIQAKLRTSRNTGLMTLVQSLWYTAYCCWLWQEPKKQTFENASKVFSPARLSGTNFDLKEKTLPEDQRKWEKHF
jgi:hypothetical protein